jgi:hypothetical protein
MAVEDIEKWAMNPIELIQEISAQDFDLDGFVYMVIENSSIRDEIVRQMLTHRHIMVYYHCYDVVSAASQARPDLFYPYWREIAALLHHENSYHRDIALTIIANLTRVDEAGLFSAICGDYFEHINDPKFMTGLCCVHNSLKIFQSKPELRDFIVALLLDVDRRCAYLEKQKALMKASILDFFDATYADVSDREGVNAFIWACLTSRSPKTRKKARELAKKFGLG